jgi:hypothetical protein
MKPVHFLLPLSLMCLLPVQAQTTPDAGGPVARPLNLSLPRDLTRSPTVTFGADASRDPVANNLQAAQIAGGPGRMPYGSGYEARRRGTPNPEDGTAMRGAAPGSHSGSRPGGSGGGGRGGMGRGR